MVRFSCFQAHTHFNFNKHKKTVQLSAEAMQKTLEDSSQSRSMSNYSSLGARNKNEGNTLNNNADQANYSSLAEFDCKSEEIEDTDHESAVYNDTQIKKCLSLGSGLNQKDRAHDLGGFGDEMDQKVSSGGTADRSEIIEVDESNNPHGLSVSDLYQEPIPSDSVQVNDDIGKESISSIGDSKIPGKECTDEDYIQLPTGVVMDEHTPYSPPAIVRSGSLPSMFSPNRLSRSSLQYSRSSEDLNALGSRKKGTLHDVGRQFSHQGVHSSRDNENNKGEFPVDETYETYETYVGSAKDWIIPSDGADMNRSMKGETSFNHWETVPAKDFRLRRIEEWVNDLKHCSSLEESDEVTSADNHVFQKANDLPEKPTAAKPEIKVVNPGSEAAKKYISSLNASATAAQLTNLGLVVIPFLSAFASLKALNLSGNSIGRITAGALPRGLHILNLSRNSISTIEGLRELTRLRVLDLSYNRILRIGHGLAGCSSLKELYLAGNKISEVEGLHRLLKLNVLDLRFNKISTAKCLGQLASNYNCLQALSLEGNPAQKNVGDEQLKKYVQSLLPHLTYYNRQSVKVGKDAADRSARLSIGAHQIDRGLRVEAKNSRKGTHGIVAQKVASSSSHGRKSQVVSTQKPSRSRHARLPPSGTKAPQVSQATDFSSRLVSLRNGISIRRSRSEGTLGALQ